MEVRPRLKIELTKGDRVLEMFCLSLLLLLWIGTVAFYSKLPDQIPTHYNASGKADDYSNRSHIFTLPIVATIIYIGMTLLNKHPHLYNYPAKVTAENAKQLYSSTTKLIRWLKLIVVIIFSGIVFMTYKISLTNGGGLGSWFLPLSAGLLLILPGIVYLFKAPGIKQQTTR